MHNPRATNSIKRQKRIPTYITALLLAPLALWAASPGRIEKTVETTVDPEVSLINSRGQVMVRGWDKSEVHAICNTTSPRVTIDTQPMPKTGKAERLQFTTRAMDPAVTGNDQAADCALEVPAGASVEIRNRQGAVIVERLSGQHARVESADAKITALDVSGHFTARSLGGDIEVVRPSGRVETYSITGNLAFIAPTSKDLRGNTNSGHIRYEGDFMPAGEYILSTYSGNIEVALPPSASFELNAKTVRGKVDNAFSLKPKRHSAPPFPSAHSLLGTYNTGNANVELTSFSGRILVRPQR